MNMNDDERQDRDMDLLKKYVAQLGEFFDSVHIFATRAVNDGTINCQYGSGNWFARYGQVRAWALKEDQGFRNMAPADDEED
jgi:hypothetical protein